MAHTIAPGANITLVETPVSETEGVTGFPQIVKAENYVIKHHLGAVISQSFSATEQTFTGLGQINYWHLRSAYVSAAARRTARPCSPPPGTAAWPTWSSTARPTTPTG